jgi:pilus assembly protein CpaB
MDRNTRTLIVVLVALVAASAASYGVYRAIGRPTVREVEVAHTFVVAAARTIPVGVRVTAADLKLVAWPERAPVAGSFPKIEPIVGRGAITQILENEPVTETKLAPLEGGAGLPVTIPPGMRAISVRVNEVVGVAGFVIPGTRVDVIVTLKQGNETVTRVVVSNVQVLTAGTRYDQDKSKGGEPIPSSVVTLLLTPEDAGRVVLASSDGNLMLALRNPLDVAPTATTGTRTGNLFSSAAAVPSAEAASAASPKPRAARPRPAAVEVERQPPPPPPPKPYTVEAIRGAKRSEETVR